MTPIFTISFAVFAIHYTMQEGEIFGIAQKINLKKFADPLRDCPVCMVPYYGTALFLLFFDFTWRTWGITVLAAMGLNAILVKLFPDKESPTLHAELSDITDAVKKQTAIFQEEAKKNRDFQDNIVVNHIRFLEHRDTQLGMNPQPKIKTIKATGKPVINKRDSK